MKTLVLNKSNVFNDGRNSRFRYLFSTPIQFEKGDKIALSNAQIPYSNFNIMSQYNNNRFTYSGFGSPTVFNVTFPDGFYSVEDMNYYFQQVMIINGHYLVNQEGEYVYYMKISTNQNRYRIQLDLFDVPTVLPTGWTNPSGWNIALMNSHTFLINFTVSSFQSLLGFDAGLYGGTSSNISYLSQNVPSPALVNSYLITVPTIVSQSNINLNNNSALYAKTPDVDFGNNLILEPANLIWVDINAGSYSFVDVILASGDDGLPLTLQDPNSLIMLVIKSKDE